MTFVLGRRGTLILGGALAAMTVMARAEQVAPAEAQQGATSSDVRTSVADLVKPPGLPEIGKWMLDSTGAAAHWLGERDRGKSLREPINVILIDEAASDPEEAKARVLDASRAAGYPARMGHSSGYQAFIDGRLHPQLPIGRDDAFSDEPFEFSNNHGRIFGPHKVGDIFVFVAAFSREEVDPFRWPGHRYASFNRARDDFTQRLDRSTPFKVSGFVSLNNAILNDPAVTTGDHDGIAVLVRAKTK